ncbi:MAG TPA: LLM class F420-dependent oxidoreductase [Solirubrobacteraceae bacterium]|nr:LLM class F420-dependent oxidoreductase [Solirubrobacteraceae bacterium]
MASAFDLGRIGVWSRELRFHDDRAAAAQAAAELEELGFGALWIPDVGGDVLGAADHLLGATRRIPLATGILNIWMHDPAQVSAGVAALTRAHGERFLLGLGASHAAVVDAERPGRYGRPYSAMVAYLDELDAQPQAIAPARRVLAALGPRMLELARDRGAGAHPYLVTPEHTRAAREVLGPDRLLAPELSVVLERDSAVSLGTAREFVSHYLALPNYVNNLRRLGFDEAELSPPGSDRLVRALVATGDEQQIAARVAEHHAAGADHVAIHIVGAGETLPLKAWRRLAPALLA